MKAAPKVPPTPSLRASAWEGHKHMWQRAVGGKHTSTCVDCGLVFPLDGLTDVAPEQWTD